MTEKKIIVKETHESFSTEKKKVRTPYSKPVLQKLGDLRTLTLGGSPGTGDSGGGFGVSFPPGVSGSGFPIEYP